MLDNSVSSLFAYSCNCSFVALSLRSARSTCLPQGDRQRRANVDMCLASPGIVPLLSEMFLFELWILLYRSGFPRARRSFLRCPVTIGFGCCASHARTRVLL